MYKSLLIASLLLPCLVVKAQCPPGETMLTMSITTDAYGQETTWEVYDALGTLLASGGPYPQQSQIGSYPQPPEDFCIPDNSAIVLVVHDSYGDGLCCAVGAGLWELTTGGVLLGSGDTFMFTDSLQLVTGTDAGIVANMPTQFTQGSIPVVADLFNNGIDTIHGFIASYKVDVGAPVIETFPMTLPPGGSDQFSFSTPWAATPGGHQIIVEVSGIPGDALSNNNADTLNVQVAGQVAQRTTLLEMFSSSTCFTCADWASDMSDSLFSLGVNANGSLVATIAHQMDWPVPGNDPSYNQDAEDRRALYGVTTLPKVILDGVIQPQDAVSTQQVQQATMVPAFMQIDLSHTLVDTTLLVDVTITPMIDMPGAHKLFITVVERIYYYFNSTSGQSTYEHVMRKMLPTSQGIDLNGLQASSSLSFSESHTFSLGGPAQGDYTLWGDMQGLSVIAFVQDQSTGQVVQAAVVSADDVNVQEENAPEELTLYPMPNNGSFRLFVRGGASGPMTGKVLGQDGRQLAELSLNGNGPIDVDLTYLPSGMYLMEVLCRDGRVWNKRFIIR